MKAQIISFHCVLRDPMGKVISYSFNHDVLTAMVEERSKAASLAKAMMPGYLDFHEPLRGLVEGLQGVKQGEKRKIFVSAERAYGLYDPALCMEVPRKKLPFGDALDVGYQVVTQSNEGEPRVFRVIAADLRKVTLDGNHPLAGQDLCFDIEATATREATAEEIEKARIAKPGPLMH